MSERRGRKPKPGAARVVPLYRQGVSPAEIVRRTRVSKSRVSQILIAAGLNPKAGAAAARRERERRVRRLWQAGRDRHQIAGELGLTPFQVDTCLRNLRRRGVPLRPQPSRPRPKTHAVEALFRKGLTASEIIARKVAGPNQVYVVRRRLAERGELDYRYAPRVVGAARAALRAKVARLAEKGLNRSAIAKRLRVTPAQVKYCMVLLSAAGTARRP